MAGIWHSSRALLVNTHGHLTTDFGIALPGVERAAQWCPSCACLRRCSRRLDCARPLSRAPRAAIAA
eukprot:2474987-Alexandrium_andersonii.AAC.1